MNDIGGQLRAEWLHLAFLVVYSAGAYLISRALRSSDERIKKIEDELERHVEVLGSLSRQVRDTRAAVACCETHCGIQHYPYTD